MQSNYYIPKKSYPLSWEYESLNFIVREMNEMTIYTADQNQFGKLIVLSKEY